MRFKFKIEGFIESEDALVTEGNLCVSLHEMCDISCEHEIVGINEAVCFEFQEVHVEVEEKK